MVDVNPRLAPAKIIEEAKSYVDYTWDEPGSMPGTLQVEPDAPTPEIYLVDYRDGCLVEKTLNHPADCEPYLDSQSVSWVDMRGLGNEPMLQELGRVFGLHPLVLEDVVNVPQRAKTEEYPDQILYIARMVLPLPTGTGFVSEQVSFILGQHYLLTVQEEPDRDCFHMVRRRLQANKGSIRKLGPDYLMYSLIDAIIDGFFPVLEDYGERIEELEEEVVTRPTRQTLKRVHAIRRELLALRRAIWPQRDAINTLIRDENLLVTPEVRIYLRDCYDHAVQVLDMVETYRELAASLMDIYLSSVSNRMNEIIKVLTIISTIFIPLTFIVGVYGMNFNTERSPYNMPELNWYWGYPLVWAVMLTIIVSLLFYFWKKGWFENFADPKN
ncbi:magnesium/cobalt transporter CorA [Candidatus Cyanaurora vandensis]|uniref:magnesium/cobalt transporter CorA n=1 Tax=Candidatus Cyanaurora vandensis TaxID=2714958 RepID=UPI00257CD3A1|nr:magnesium/cobalt transporter CorA [Candidatus Cyanaurora vandensis]